MKQLVIPNKDVHKYVVGIDFGHGETSAAMCGIEWNKTAGQREDNVLDVDLDSRARKKVITSAISFSNGNSYIGDEAFEHTDDNSGICVCFKQKPKSLDGKMEKLMIEYMKAVYSRIRESQPELTDDNHIVYIARPSGWNEETAKGLYRQMALTAGIPLAGLTSESRAAIFYAKSPSINFAKEIALGAMVFDLGSSTLDFTYLSDKEQPIDHGYNLGASIIDETILQNMILNSEEMRAFLDKYPVYHDALSFKARKFKEEAYSRNEASKTTTSFFLESIISENAASYNDCSDVLVKLKIANLKELNDLISVKTNYMQHIKEALEDFRDHHIQGKVVNGVFLTGGASRMNFILPIISEVFRLPSDKIKIDPDNPSLTISRGIALLGTAGAISSILVAELRTKLSGFISNAEILSGVGVALAENITNEAWKIVSEGCSCWVTDGKTTNEKELKEIIEKKLRTFQQYGVSAMTSIILQKYVSTSSEELRKKMNEIISLYAPGREISFNETIQLGQIQTINDSLSDLSSEISKICDSISNIVADILWIALAAFLWGVFCLPYYIYKIFRSDEVKRRKKAEQILKKKEEITKKVLTKIFNELENNKVFEQAVTSSFGNYFTRLMETNLKQVIIPIE